MPQQNYVVKIGDPSTSSATTDSVALTSDPPVIVSTKEGEASHIIFNANSVPQLIVPWKNLRYVVLASLDTTPPVKKK